MNNNKYRSAVLFVVTLLAFSCSGQLSRSSDDSALPWPEKLISIVVIPVNPSIAKGTSQQFTATGIYADTSDRDITSSVTWSSSSEDKATVSNILASEGLVTSSNTGTTTIIATLNDKNGSSTLTVTAAELVSIDVTPVNQSIAKGLTLQFVATGTFSDTSNQDITSSVAWSSSNQSSATVNNSSSKGLITSFNTGTTLVMATLSGKTGNSTLNVTPAELVSIAVAPVNLYIAMGTNRQFTATGIYTDISNQDLTSTVTWSSSSEDTAVVSNTSGSEGLVTSVSTGSTIITAAFNAKVDNSTLTVKLVSGTPDNTANAVTFIDSDRTINALGGMVQINKADDESNIKHYVLYWGDVASNKVGSAIATIAATGASLTHSLPIGTFAPLTATQLLVFPKNDLGEGSAKVSCAVDDVSLFPTTSWLTATPETHGYTTSDLQATATWASNHGANSFLVMKDGYILHEEYFDGKDQDTPVLVWSVTKSFTSVIIGIATDLGYLDINNFAHQYGTGWASGPSDQVRVVNLMGNDSGRYWSSLADYFIPTAVLTMTPPYNSWGGSVTDYALSLGQAEVVGTTFTYNNMAIQCLERVLTSSLTTASAGTLDNFFMTKLTQPLGMTNTSLTVDAGGNVGLYAGASSTAQDMARFGWLLLNRGNWNGTQVVSSSYLAQAITAHAPIANYGYLIWLNSTTSGTSCGPMIAECYMSSLPTDAYYAYGLYGQFILISPSENLVIIRTGSTGGGYDGNNTGFLVNNFYDGIKGGTLP